eukprot:GHVR01176587.1.p1 GENE.GHVR01176587.1~~GHVR01176587.1.p1  ORF type:complete len:197 (-),score=36.46 GHVR01176587.1:281-871(-)
MMTSDEIVEATFPVRVAKSLERIFGLYLGKTTIYPKTRWSISLCLVLLYVLRVYLAGGFYVVSYGFAICELNLFLAFISPQSDPELEGPVLPTTDSEEFRPFQRRLPEFKFWQYTTMVTVACLIFTLFRVLDIPVFWPILVVYFIVLFCFTMKQQIQNMIKHKYIPVSFGKQTYGDITRGKNSRHTHTHTHTQMCH